MTNIQTLSEAQVILLAARLVSEAKLESLQSLISARRLTLHNAFICQLLLTLYPSDEATIGDLIPFLKSLQDDFSKSSALDTAIDTTVVAKLSEGAALEQTRGLQLRELRTDKFGHSQDITGDFIISWVHRLESESGAIESVRPLVEAFATKQPKLQTWYTAYLIPVLRLQYEFYPSVPAVIGVQELENLTGLRGVRELLQYAEQEKEHAQISRDLNDVVAPWIRGASSMKRRRLSANVDESRSTLTSWTDVNEWLLSTSITNFPLASKAASEWDGPGQDVATEKGNEQKALQQEYSQALIAIAYAAEDGGTDTISKIKNILQRAAMFAHLTSPDFSQASPVSSSTIHDLGVSEADLMLNTLLKPENKLTVPSNTSLHFLSCVLRSVDVLNSYRVETTVNDVARICLFASEERQKQQLRRLLQQVPRLTAADINWQLTRKNLLWLWSWQTESGQLEPQVESRAYLARVRRDFVEIEILKAMLAASQYQDVKEVYVEHSDHGLQPSVIEQCIISTIFEAYDNASNGNRTRGGMKRAFEILKYFQPLFPKSESFQRIDQLIKATHNLSFYQLTLQHGVPFKPVNIRVQKDPLGLIGKVLEQDSKAYTKLDDLLEIGRNLVLALSSPNSTGAFEHESIESKVQDSQHRITYLAITSALAAHDFDTAYSYITTRLSTSPSRSPASSFVDDTSWRAVYAAGKYRPAASPQTIHARISSLSKRMDLLSLALTLTPTSESLPEILGTWRRCEEEMDGLKAQAVEEERAFESRSDEAVPGGFGPDDRDVDAAETKKFMARRTLTGGAASYEEQAPMGLFDVARGAASALRQTAFPLGGGALKDLKIRDATTRTLPEPTSPSLGDPTIPAEGGHRVRKRDMVSNMVTGGLVSGMSWVLGAQPVETHQEHDH